MNWVARSLVVMLLVVAGTALADETRGTPEEAQAMVAKAIAAYDARGEAAFVAMTSPSMEFRDRNLYVFAAGPDDLIVAHGIDANRIGSNFAEVVDSTGKELGKEMIERADEHGVWVDYMWRDPITASDMRKSSWIVRHAGYIFGCGVYKP